MSVIRSRSILSQLACLLITATVSKSSAQFLGAVGAANANKDIVSSKDIDEGLSMHVHLPEKHMLWTTDRESTERRAHVRLEPFPFFMRAAVRGDTRAITLSLQSDVSRFDRLATLARMWNGPISYALLVEMAHYNDTVSRLRNLPEDVRALVDIHLVVADEQHDFYPINYMRNIALDRIDTEWVLVMDIDENIAGVPGGVGMQACLAEVEAATAATTSAVKKSAFVLNSFQWHALPERTNAGSTGGSIRTVPHSIDELKSAIDMNLVEFKHPHWEQAYTAPSISMVEWIRTHHAQVLPIKEDYEPYLVVRRNDMGSLRFDTRFVGFRGNYVTYTNRMQLEGWRFVLLPHVFTFSDETAVETSVDRSSRIQDPDLFLSVMNGLMAAAGCPPCKKTHDCFSSCPSTSTAARRAQSAAPST